MMASLGAKEITIDHQGIIIEDAVEEVIEVEDGAGVAVLVLDTDTITNIQIMLQQTIYRYKYSLILKLYYNKLSSL